MILTNYTLWQHISFSNFPPFIAVRANKVGILVRLGYKRIPSAKQSSSVHNSVS